MKSNFLKKACDFKNNLKNKGDKGMCMPSDALYFHGSIDSSSALLTIH